MTDITPYLPGILAAYAILAVGATSPGPTVALLIGIATGQGRGPALVATLGVALGSVTINLLTLAGVGLVLSQAAWAMSMLRIMGAAYLAYLAYGALKRAIHPPPLPAPGAVSSESSQQFMAGYLLQVTNPKAIAFWLAIAAVGAVEGAPLVIKALYVTGAFGISFTGHAVWALTFSIASIRAAYARLRRWIEAVLGSVFMLAAYRLAVSTE